MYSKKADTILKKNSYSRYIKQISGRNKKLHFKQ